MSVASVRNFRAVRFSLWLVASAPLAMAAPAWAAETAATATTDGSVRFGKWGVALDSRDLKTNPGDDCER